MKTNKEKIDWAIRVLKFGLENGHPYGQPHVVQAIKILEDVSFEREKAKK